MSTSEIILTLSITLILLVVLHTYMYLRLVKSTIEIKAGVYAPKYLLSMVEIVVFFAMYHIGAKLCLGSLISTPYILLCNFLAFVLSIVTVNKFTLTKLGKYQIVLSSLTILALYGLFMLIGFYA